MTLMCFIELAQRTLLQRDFHGLLAMSSLTDLHVTLCHPGITRHSHFVKLRSLPFSINGIKSVVSSCKVCSKCQPRFGRPEPGVLVKATPPFERLNIDFKGLVPSYTRNKYLLTVVDEYSRFPFVYACSDLTSETVIEKLRHLFSISLECQVIFILMLCYVMLCYVMLYLVSLQRTLCPIRSTNYVDPTPVP